MDGPQASSLRPLRRVTAVSRSSPRGTGLRYAGHLLYHRFYAMEEPNLNRRDLLAGLAFAAFPSDPPPSEASSLYIPKAHLVEDRQLLHDLMEEFAFVSLVTASPSIHVTHIPTLLNRTRGNFGTIFGHIARNNPQSETFDGKHPAVIVFNGPESYISPSWYTKAEVVPTWNFAVVHASGKLKPIEDPKALHDLLAQLIHKFEDPKKTPYDFSKLPDSFTYPMIQHIIGFEMEIELLEGKFKLGQERSEGDRQGILKGLGATKPERSLHDITEAFYRSHAATS
jgi:transcriptional regulator